MRRRHLLMQRTLCSWRMKVTRAMRRKAWRRRTRKRRRMTLPHRRRQ